MNIQQVQGYTPNTTTPSKSILNDESNVIKLIRLFRSHECLWNPNCENYRNLPFKETIWESIANQFGQNITADQVKRKVKGLRNCFSTERSRVQKSILDGRGEIYVPTLYYYKEFDFLHGIKGVSKGCGNIKTDYTEDYDDNNSPCDESMYNTTYTENNNDYNGNTSSTNQNEDMKIFEPIVLNRPEFEPPPRKKKCSFPSYSARTIDMPLPENIPQIRIKNNFNQVQSLCEMIRCDLQEISEELFYEAKWKIMDILRDVHKKHLEDKSKATYNSSSNNKRQATSTGPFVELADTSTTLIGNHSYQQP